jgi:type II secretory pathway component PulF
LARLTRQSKALRGQPVVASPHAGALTIGWGAHPLHAWWRISPGRLAFYLDQLGELLNAGVNMLDAAVQLSVHTPDGRLRRMSREIAAGSSQGQSLAEQLRRYPQLVPPHVRGMVLAAERSGTLPQALQELSDELRTQQIARWKLMLASVWFGLLLFVAVVVVPLGLRLFRASAANFANYNATEPPFQQALRVMIPVAREWFWHVFLPAAAILVIALLVAKLIVGLPRWQRSLQRVLYRVPIAGNMIRRAATTRFLVSLQGLMAAGVEIQEGLGLAAEAAGSADMTDQLQAAAARIRGGQDLTSALEPVTCLSQEAKQSLFVAERAGAYDRALASLVTMSREARRKTTTLCAIFGYSTALVVSAGLVLIALYVGYSTYFNTILDMSFE